MRDAIWTVDGLRRSGGARAALVVKWLSSHGIDKSRIASAGFGLDPIAENATEDGRRENRRVEFHIVDGPIGPHDTTIVTPAPEK